jgi:hypothetical protein
MQNGSLPLPAPAAAAGPGATARLRLLRAGFLATAAACGLLQAWIYRHDIKEYDGISYLDMGDAFFRGDWVTAVNGYWSPLYAWLLGLAQWALRPAPYWEYPLVQAVNFALYLGALGCFDFLLRELIRWQRGQAAGLVALPEWAWLALGYPLFLWSALYWVCSWMPRPDTCLSALVYAAAGLLLRIRRGAAGWGSFALLGAVLGFGYLTKAAMFPLALVFLLAGLVAVGDLRRGVPRVLAALAVFLLIAGPLVVTLSRAKGRWTVGDAGRVNYLWAVKRVAAPHWPHWQGEGADAGAPEHPSRRVFHEPAVYEFRTPVGGTYPMWYDPSWWYQGATPHFRPGEEMTRLVASARFYRDFFSRGPTCVLVVGLAALYLRGWRRGACVREAARQGVLLLPAVAALSMYALICVEPRYIGAFVVLLCLSLFAGVRLPEGRWSRGLMAAVTLAVAATFLTALGVCTAKDVRKGEEKARVGAPAGAGLWQVAEGLKQMGVQAGDEVAVIGSGIEASRWARLARVRIIAELPEQDQEKFWQADRPTRAQVMAAFAATGARVVVTTRAAGCDPASGWRRVGDTQTYACLLRR